MVEAGAEGIYVTLSIGGTTLHGELISEQRYFEGTSAKIRTDQPGNEDALRELFAGLPSTMDEAAMRLMDTGKDIEDIQKARKRLTTSFIHLKNTGLLSSSGTFINMEGGLWRGKVLAVDGFWLGDLD